MKNITLPKLRNLPPKKLDKETSMCNSESSVEFKNMPLLSFASNNSDYRSVDNATVNNVSNRSKSNYFSVQDERQTQTESNTQINQESQTTQPEKNKHAFEYEHISKHTVTNSNSLNVLNRATTELEVIDLNANHSLTGKVGSRSLLSCNKNKSMMSMMNIENKLQLLNNSIMNDNFTLNYSNNNSIYGSPLKNNNMHSIVDNSSNNESNTLFQEENAKLIDENINLKELVAQLTEKNVKLAKENTLVNKDNLPQKDTQLNKKLIDNQDLYNQLHEQIENKDLEIKDLKEELKLSKDENVGLIDRLDTIEKNVDYTVSAASIKLNEYQEKAFKHDNEISNLINEHIREIHKLKMDHKYLCKSYCIFCPHIF